MSDLPTEVRIGQVWRDKDKREQGKRVLVIGFEGEKVICRRGPRTVSIRIDRLVSRFSLGSAEGHGRR